ncbi:glucosaminidase domain-containing protein, partial [Leptolyngbya sp. FACHB-36]|uniref:glucosaminidase domain-containing protein n=1 Tax=Leptolyngbya sp. FACHB-36 TaxID=2692808 RepID=UPI0016812C28
IVSGNAFIPIDLADRLGVDVTKDPNVRRITYGSIVYIKSIDLRNYNVSVNWDSTTRTVLLRSTAVPGDIDRITGKGKTSEVQLMMFLKSNNEAGLTQFPEIAQLYREEGDREVINYDIAFCQMCVETNFLRFGGSVKPSQNNFANLGSIGGGAEGASFPSARIGVRAHIQHLKAYANTEPLAQEVVDPRFDFVARGIAPLVGMLSGRWNNNPQYGEIILARLKQLYEQAGLM